MTTRRIFLDGKTANPEDYYEYFNDFTKPTDYDTNDWTLTTVEAGAGSATEAIGNLAGGVLVVTNDAADDDSDFFQSTKEVFKFVSGKKLYFAMRFKISDVTQSDFVAGLQITDTTPLAVTDGIYFRKDDGDAFLDFVVIKDSSATTKTAVATLTNDTYVKVAFYYDGSEMAIYVNDVAVGDCALTNVPDDEELAISFGIQNGEAVAKILSVDYIRALVER
jgi:hypothetical protein